MVYVSARPSKYRLYRSTASNWKLFSISVTLPKTTFVKRIFFSYNYRISNLRLGKDDNLTYSQTLYLSIVLCPKMKWFLKTVLTMTLIILHH